MPREWCDSQPEHFGDAAKPRFKQLYELLRSGKMEIRVLPDEVFGLIHGKAGVVTPANGRRTSFLGSANESRTAFRLNYELVWEDDSPETVIWVQEEFDVLWSSPFAVRYHEVERVGCESCARVLADNAKRQSPARGRVEPVRHRSRLPIARPDTVAPKGGGPAGPEAGSSRTNHSLRPRAARAWRSRASSFG